MRSHHIALPNKANIGEVIASISSDSRHCYGIICTKVYRLKKLSFSENICNLEFCQRLIYNVPNVTISFKIHTLYSTDKQGKQSLFMRAYLTTLSVV